LWDKGSAAGPGPSGAAAARARLSTSVARMLRGVVALVASALVAETDRRPRVVPRARAEVLCALAAAFAGVSGRVRGFPDRTVV